MTPEDALALIREELAGLRKHLGDLQATMSFDSERIAMLEDVVPLLEKQIEAGDKTAVVNRSDAGQPEDQRHRDVIDREISQSENRTEIKVQSLRDVVSQIARELGSLQNTTIVIIGVAALVLAVLVNIGYKALGG